MLWFCLVVFCQIYVQTKDAWGLWIIIETFENCKPGLQRKRKTGMKNKTGMSFLRYEKKDYRSLWLNWLWPTLHKVSDINLAGLDSAIVNNDVKRPAGEEESGICTQLNVNGCNEGASSCSVECSALAKPCKAFRWLHNFKQLSSPTGFKEVTHALKVQQVLKMLPWFSQWPGTTLIRIQGKALC